MCQIYSGTDPELYQCVSRSIRINGVVTSLRLELRFWQILDEIAAGEGFSTPQFLGKIHDEVFTQRGDIPNFASLMRVICTVYLEKQAGLHAATASSADAPGQAPSGAAARPTGNAPPSLLAG